MSNDTATETTVEKKGQPWNQKRVAGRTERVRFWTEEMAKRTAQAPGNADAAAAAALLHEAAAKVAEASALIAKIPEGTMFSRGGREKAVMLEGTKVRIVAKHREHYLNTFPQDVVDGPLTVKIPKGGSKPMVYSSKLPGFFGALPASHFEPVEK